MAKKILDESKILLVIVSKNKVEMQQQIDLFNRTNLSIPNEHSLEIHVIVGSKNLAASFNEVQKKFDAKYKIYLTAPVSYVHQDFINSAVEGFFLSPNTRMIGLLGSEMPISGDYTKAESFYGQYNYVDEKGELQSYLGKDPLYIQSVDMLEGGFFATNIDISWDEKIGEDFILATQCCKFRSQGYDICVVYQDKAWLIFSKDAFSYNFKENQQNYQKQLGKFCSLYQEKRMPLVSILIPTYNQPEFCMEALESALNQTYPNIEILVGDDSTNEDTKKAIQPYLKKHKNIQYFYHNGSIPRGGGRNMSFLLNRCQGEYVNYLLHDDMFYPEKIFKMMNYYVNDLENRICLVTSARDALNKDGMIMYRKNPWQPHSDIILSGGNVGRQLLFILANFIGELTTALFRKKDVLTKNPRQGEPSFVIGRFCGVYSKSYGDMDTWLEILKSGGDMVFIAESLSAFRHHEAQNTNNPSTRIQLPLDCLTFIVIAWLNNVFFRDNKDFYYCLDKWPIMADRWFKPIREDDSEKVRKAKEWIIKLREVIVGGEREKMLDDVISYLLDSMPQNINFTAKVRKNISTGLWEKNDAVPLDTRGLDLCDNFWLSKGYSTISHTNGKLKNILQCNGYGIYTANTVTFGEADFTIAFNMYMDRFSPVWSMGFHATPVVDFIKPRYVDCIFLGRFANEDALAFSVCDSSEKEFWERQFKKISALNILGTSRHYEIDYDHANQKIYLFADGKLVHSQTEPVVKRIPRYIQLGILFQTPFIGSISEFILKDGICMHTSDFTPPTEPYEKDEYTISLLHFDE